MSAELLREAAALMRERAEAATPGPWEAEAWDSGHSRYEMNASVITVEHGDQICDMNGLGRASNEMVAKDDGRVDAAHIASWHPAVALAVADWLDATATDLEVEDGHDGWDSSVYTAALAAARAYLGRES